ncbi:hypothetical protein [Brevundimonas sp. UBA7664]|uniref:hypothetical protein n=1 Tax=Brevundimonas sp. UBA7664 TaxID=1946141 RepID=UPI0025BFAD6C|nr:hypothetical protein [Brevundimonas sp. UBA7664]
MRIANALWLFALSVAMPNFASACDYGEPPLDGLQVKTSELANRMVAEAAFVEVVSVESTAPLSLDEHWRSLWEAELAAPEFDALRARADRIQFNPLMVDTMRWVTFSVVEHLKGEHGDRFTWSAHYDESRTPYSGLEQNRFRDPLAFNYSPKSTLLQGIDEGSCSNVIRVQPNTLYLVFRDGIGNILREPVIVRDHDRLQNWTFHNLPVFEPVSEDDQWLDAVRAAARR